MYLFLIPLLFGFAFNVFSAFTAAFSRQWGTRRGSMVTAILRNVLGIPVWPLGFLLAWRTDAPGLFPSVPPLEIIGWAFLVAGACAILVALLTITWRAAIPSMNDSLVEEGIYAQVRHPIHGGTLLEFIGLLLIGNTHAIALACSIGILWVLVQTSVEERDLLDRLPEYAAYMKRVPRFLPRIPHE